MHTHKLKSQFYKIKIISFIKVHRFKELQLLYSRGRGKNYHEYTILKYAHKLSKWDFVITIDPHHHRHPRRCLHYLMKS